MPLQAIVAVAHKLLTAICHMLRTGTEYQAPKGSEIKTTEAIGPEYADIRKRSSASKAATRKPPHAPLDHLPILKFPVKAGEAPAKAFRFRVAPSWRTGNYLHAVDLWKNAMEAACAATEITTSIAMWPSYSKPNSALPRNHARPNSPWKIP